MDIGSAIGSARAASESRTIARESASLAATSNASTTTTASDTSQNAVQNAAGQTAAAETVRTTASGQFYVSPFLTFDSRSLTVIFQVRDTESGDVERQFPAESVVERYRRDPSARPFVLPEPEASEGQQAGPPPPTIGGPVTQALRDADAGAPEAPGGAATDTDTPARAAGPDTAPTQPAASSPSPAVRSTIDLVA